jgi:hypothetical protein
MDSLPVLSPGALALLDTPLPALGALRVALTGGGSAKYHVPLSDLKRGYTFGRYARPAAGAASYPLLEVSEQVCKKCSVVLLSRGDGAVARGRVRHRAPERA